MGRLVEVADTRLYIEERGELSAFPLLVFHGGPGLDHTMFGDRLDPLTEEGRYRLVLVDDRACGRSDRMPWRETWMLGRMARDVSDLAASLGVSERYATLGHSYGAFVGCSMPSTTRGSCAARLCRRASLPRAGSKRWTGSRRRSSQPSCASR